MSKVPNCKDNKIEEKKQNPGPGFYDKSDKKEELNHKKSFSDSFNQ